LNLGVDVGGTFTDLYAYDPEKNVSIVQKVPSTPNDFKEGVFNAIEKANIDFEQVEFFIHGSTICTNAIIQRACPITPFIATEGFQDLMAIGRYHRISLYHPYQQRPSPLIRRRYTFGVPERITCFGEVLKPLDKQRAQQISRMIKKLGVKSVCVGFQNSYANPKHEEEMKEILKKDNPDLFVSISSTIPKIRELKRYTTAAVRAMLWPIMGKYVGELIEGLTKRGFHGKVLFVVNNGGMIDSGFAVERPELTLLSGPAAGIGGALFIANEIGRQNILTMDMGGTSCDVSICEEGTGSVTMTTEREIDFDMPISVPTVDVRTIGSGGGSIAWIDRGGSIRVGPQSAGAIPGPACYGRGGEEPTVTDANLLLGRLGVDSMVKGGIRLDAERAKRAVDKIAKVLKLDIMEAAQGIIRIVNENMAATIRQVSLQRGRDPRNFHLLAAGAAGPMHAAFIAELMGIPEVIIPEKAGVLSAFGCTVVDVKHDFEKTFYSPIAEANIEALNNIYSDLDHQGRKILEEEKIFDKDIVVIRKAMMRYIGQTYEVETPVPLGKITRKQLDQIVNDFHKEHMKENGFSREDAPVAIVDIRSTAIGKLGKPALLRYAAGEKSVDYALKEKRRVFFEGLEFSETPIYEGEKLSPGNIIRGPAVLEWRDFTAVIPPKRRATMDQWKNIIIKM
jgi:N-methylhydantoinase A